MLRLSRLRRLRPRRGGHAVERFLNILPPGEPVLTAVVVDDEGTVVTLHTSDVRAVIADLWAARDLAFRAAFADEEGARVEWGVRCAGWHHGHCGFESYGTDETTARHLLRVSTEAHPLELVVHVIGPWKPVPQEKP
jgi:hypothetical protein